jgi:hypothetical protein
MQVAKLCVLRLRSQLSFYRLTTISGYEGQRVFRIPNDSFEKKRPSVIFHDSRPDLLSYCSAQALSDICNYRTSYKCNVHDFTQKFNSDYKIII